MLILLYSVQIVLSQHFRVCIMLRGVFRRGLRGLEHPPQPRLSTSVYYTNISLFPSEARFLLGTQSRSYGFKVYVVNLKKVALAHYRHSSSLAGSNNVNSYYFSSSRLPVALVL